MEFSFIRDTGIRRERLYLFYSAGQRIYRNDSGAGSRREQDSHWKIAA